MIIAFLSPAISSKTKENLTQKDTSVSGKSKKDNFPPVSSGGKATTLSPELIAKKNDIFLKIMKFGTGNERREAMHAIVEFKERDPELIKYVAEIMTRDPEQSLRNSAIKALVKMEIKTEADNYISLLKDENEDMVLQSVFALKQLEIQKGIIPLLDLLQKSDMKKNDNLTVAIIEALGALDKNQQSYNFLKDQFKNTENNAQIRAAIALYFGSSIAKNAELLLLDSANDKKEEITIRCYAINSLGKLNSKPAIPHLKKILDDLKKENSKGSSRQNQTLKIYALSALVKLGDSSIKDELFSFARDDDPVVRLRAIKFLEDINDPDVVDLLEYKAKRDPSNKVQAAATKALAKLKNGINNSAQNKK